MIAKNFSNSQATFDSISVKTLHHCPSCKCKSPPANLYTAPTFHCQASTFSSFAPNISQTCKSQTLELPLRRSFIPLQPHSQKITFFYASPPKLIRHNSLNTSFAFKNQKRLFSPNPFCRVRQSVNNNQEKALQNSVYYEKYTNEETPKKHDILKEKSKKLEGFLRNRKEQNVEWKEVKHDGYVALDLKEEKTEMEYKTVDVRKMNNEDEIMFEEKLSMREENKQQSHRNLDKDRPELSKQPERVIGMKGTHEDQLAIWKADEELSAEIALALSAELKLNYEYYTFKQVSDRSLSSSVTF